MNYRNNKNWPKDELILGGIIVGLLLIIIILYGLAIFRIVDIPQNRGLFGDMFGALNVFFTALAFAATIITLRTQMKEIKNSNEQTERSNTISALQSFVESHKSVENNDSVEIAKSILFKLTNEIFTDKRNWEFSKPEILFRKSRKVSVNGSHRMITIPFKNTGPAFNLQISPSITVLKHEINQIVKSPLGGGTTNKITNHIERNSDFKIEIEINKDIENFFIDLNMEASTTKLNWSRSITFENISSDFTVTIGETK